MIHNHFPLLVEIWNASTRYVGWKKAEQCFDCQIIVKTCQKW